MNKIIEMFKNKPHYLVYFLMNAIAAILYIIGVLTMSITCLEISGLLFFFYGIIQGDILEHMNAGNTALSDIIKDQTEQIVAYKDEIAALNKLLAQKEDTPAQP